MTLLDVRTLTVTTPNGRVLVRDLSLKLGTQKVALVGRNGVGKTTLLETLAGLRPPASGSVHFRHPPYLVSQWQDSAECSPGEQRRQRLWLALESDSELLLLDEPSLDLDAASLHWLRGALRRRKGAKIVVSHDPQLLQDFEHFFVLSESGGRYFQGSFLQLQDFLEEQQRSSQLSYLRRLQQMVRHTQDTQIVADRRARKRRRGRVKEMDRATPRCLLNSKRDVAQDTHGRQHQNRQARLEEVRQWALAGRRALRVELPLVPAQLEGTAGPRLAIVGPNGSGKTTLLEQWLCSLDPGQVAWIAQGASNWMLPECLAELVSADQVVAHKFPLALAQRPLHSLSPGERLRAILICLHQRVPLPPILTLDEPTYSLDLLGRRSLSQLLRHWPGQVIIASHDRDFLESLNIHHWIQL
jgi:ATPase subunit of ABC transporter with duplicated ATPase domains